MPKLCTAQVQVVPQEQITNGAGNSLCVCGGGMACPMHASCVLLCTMTRAPICSRTQSEYFCAWMVFCGRRSTYSASQAKEQETREADWS